jgi:hypothetical protein
MFDDQACQKIEKVVAALKITSRTQANGRKSTRLHRVGRFIVFMCLAVSTKGSTAMIFVGEVMVQDNLTRAKNLAETPLEMGKLLSHIVMKCRR